MSQERQDSILKKKRIATLTLGCKVNQYETDGMRELLEQAGCELVEFQETADVYIVNTCSVTNMAERKSRQMLHRAKKQNSQSIVVAVGCYVQTVPQEVLEDLSVDLVIGNDCKKNIVGILEEYLTNQEGYLINQKENLPKQERYLANQTENASAWLPIENVKEYEDLQVTHMSEHTRAYIKIQDGCNQFCSYCIIPYVRGRIRSRQPEEIVSEVRRLAEQGCKEVVLTGIHLSSYGKEKVNCEKNENIDLIKVIKLVQKIDGILRIRLGSLEPRIITEEFVAELQKCSKVCPHFHLSLQSACNETLKRMNRKYTIEEYMKSCHLLRKAYDRPALTTDVIVGFPGETEEEFDTTYRNLEALGLYEIHVFKYSKRRGTLAESMPNQVTEPEKSRRSDILLALTQKQKKAYESSFRGELVQVLVEESLGENRYIGHTERYVKVEVCAERDVRNQIVEMVY